MSNERKSPPIGAAEAREALGRLSRYQAAKAPLERRLEEDELWWELRHWETEGARGAETVRPSSAWLFNVLTNKHADAMDSFPEPLVLPREESDRESAEVLSQVLPVVLEMSEFEQGYSDNWWEKLKHGTAAYGVFWNQERENGLGDVDVRPLDLRKLFWEPGVEDLQQSRDLFIVELARREEAEARWPQLKGKAVPDAAHFVRRGSEDTDKLVLVDWYYKKTNDAGRAVLHYAKLAGEEVLFASENEEAYAQRGYYDHGKYPVVLDVLFPEKGSPVGFGYVAVCKDPQMYVDKLSAAMLENALVGAKKRFFVSGSTGVNEEEFLDTSRPLVHVEGSLDETRIREIVTRPLDGVYLSLVQSKISEMKDTASNRDVNAGSTSHGVTAAAAIAALQEAGSKSSRDMIAASYRAHGRICRLVLELMSQFYDESRSFRVAGRGAEQFRFARLSREVLAERAVGRAADGTALYRRPVFDLKVSAQKKNPFSRMEQNERARALFSMGFFRPERRAEALLALEMMDFEGAERVREKMGAEQ